VGRIWPTPFLPLKPLSNLSTKDLDRILEGCFKRDPKCQRVLYEKYARPMLGICLRYTKDRMEAEDVLQMAFVKVFRFIDTFSGGSFEGWLKRIFIRESINQYHHRRRKPIDFLEDGDLKIANYQGDGFVDALSGLSVEEIMSKLNNIPEGSRLVFNLFAIEGYTHPEIAELLGITEGTSKSQYARARHLLKAQLNHLLI
jgi:RNA polymerase sigma factor (sigma-70 family)